MGKFSRNGFWRRIVCALSASCRRQEEGILAAGCTNLYRGQRSENRGQISVFCFLSSAFYLLSFRRKNGKDRSWQLLSQSVDFIIKIKQKNVENEDVEQQ